MSNPTQVTVTSGAFVDLGPAPVSVLALSGSVNIVVADSAPGSLSSPGQIVSSGPFQPYTFNPSDAYSHVFAVAIGATATLQTSLSPTTNVAPVLDSNSAAFQGKISGVDMTVGQVYTPGRSIRINCTVAGNVSLTLPDGSIEIIPVSVGYQTFPFAVTQINVSGTTATATYANLK